jgi:hypothetical protein
VRGISAEGVVSLAAEHFDGPVSVRVANLDEVRLHASPSEAPTPLDRVSLTNDDAVAGAVQAIGPEALRLDGAAVGRLRIDRKYVAEVLFNPAAANEVISRFAYGLMAPWEAVRGEWRVADGKLVCQNPRRRPSYVAAPFDGNRSFTFVAEVEPDPGLSLQFLLFAQDKNTVFSDYGVMVHCAPGYYRMQYLDHGNQVRLDASRFEQRLSRVPEREEYRVVFDDEARRIRLWHNRRHVGGAEAPVNAIGGDVVALSAMFDAKIHTLRVRRGVIEPTFQGGGDGAPKEHLLVFQNEDRMEAASLRLEGATLTTEAHFGEMTVPRKALARIAFAAAGRERPRRRKGEVIVETLHSRFTLHLKEMNDEALLGASEPFGDVAVDRRAVRRILFNIYR